MTLAEKLSEAQAAYHRLQIGESASVVVDQNGERVEYRPASLAKLAAYIGDLQSQIAGTKRPATVTFQTSKGVN
ncbi:gpW family protein [Octadecabacter sp. G9-8]|uniref:GpW family protein n=1 Tax=Octadecabacter dasysiphoniae TaxID=2909341 RepID=A0ABS9CSU3_9RHOB|nr:gpW family protein [Octadecabacter dasysiphoniae]MCF2870308.1 gpW family protein [Octadecabacter dasysiphoniae]